MKRSCSTSPLLLLSANLRSRSFSCLTEENPVVRRTALTRPPPTVKATGLLWNSCSLVGRVVYPLKTYGTAGRPGGFTWLDVHHDVASSSAPHFRILLVIWDELAEKALKHLQRDDVIYVWGPLSCYDKTDDTGKREVVHKLTVRDLNYVMMNDKSKKSLHPRISENECEEDLERNSGGHLRLWQVFFSNPEEWWDNRRTKRNTWHPDFKHKFTHERLMLSPDDPPWVKKQLELYDARVTQMRSGLSSDWSSII